MKRPADFFTAPDNKSRWQNQRFTGLHSTSDKVYRWDILPETRVDLGDGCEFAETKQGLLLVTTWDWGPDMCTLECEGSTREECLEWARQHAEDFKQSMRDALEDPKWTRAKHERLRKKRAAENKARAAKARATRERKHGIKQG